MMDILGTIPWWLWLGLLGGGGGAILAFVPGALAACLAIWNMLPRWVQFLLGGIVVVIFAYLKGRNTGHQIARDQQKANDAKAVQTRLDVEKDVQSMTQKQKDDRLEKYYRD